LKLDNALKTKIIFEISQIDKLLDSSNPLLQLCRLKVPDFIEMSASAMVLHSFYNGIETILVLICKEYDNELPSGIKWHTELFENAFLENKNRKQIFRSEINKILAEYLKFRHFVRHSYSFSLKWEKMENLILLLDDNWKKIKDDINTFIENN
jgi:hypothetical protein